MKERLLHNWTFMRVFYTLMGIIICIASVTQREWGGLLLGGYFLSMGIFAFGCAAPGGCYGGSCTTSNQAWPIRRKTRR